MYSGDIPRASYRQDSSDTLSFEWTE
jgi:hypothetical protein